MIFLRHLRPISMKHDGDYMDDVRGASKEGARVSWRKRTLDCGWTVTLRAEVVWGILIII